MGVETTVDGVQYAERAVLRIDDPNGLAEEGVDGPNH